MSKALDKRRKSSIFNESHYEEIIHPNDEKEEDTESDEDASEKSGKDSDSEDDEAPTPPKPPPRTILTNAIKYKFQVT